MTFTSARRCDDLAASLDPRHDALDIAIPRVCLKNPRWIQVGVDVFGGFSGTAESFTSRSDAWSPVGVEVTSYPPPYGPRVHRAR